MIRPGSGPRYKKPRSTGPAVARSRRRGGVTGAVPRVRRLRPASALHAATRAARGAGNASGQAGTPARTSFDEAKRDGRPRRHDSRATIGRLAEYYGYRARPRLSTPLPGGPGTRRSLPGVPGFPDARTAIPMGPPTRRIGFRFEKHGSVVWCGVVPRRRRVSGRPGRSSPAVPSVRVADGARVRSRTAVRRAGRTGVTKVAL